VDKPRILRACFAVLRHLLALGSTAAVGLVFFGLLYVDLLALAIVADGDLGGPLTPVAMPLCGLAWGLAYGGLVCLPLGALGEFLLRRKAPRLWGFLIPLILLAALLLVGLLAVPMMGAWAWAEGGLRNMRYAEIPAVIPFLVVPWVAPLLSYWTVLRGLAWLSSILARRVPGLAPYLVAPAPAAAGPLPPPGGAAQSA